MTGIRRSRRAPFQVLVYPYRVRLDRTVEIAVFRRVNGGYWQGIAGGANEGEQPADAARRETAEEAGLDLPGPWIALQPVLTVPVHFVRYEVRKHWPGWLTSIPCYPFAVLVTSATPIALSAEHHEFRWTTVEEACALVHWDNDRIALAALDTAVSPRAASEADR